ncbi:MULTISPECIES: SRPBCC domain-containing protein [unclassified Streptomyces]|uniref:SRPBCC domain-containing protein n=1 Tax=unclassified Streptomyces TaxID=2593676 RepID=UPI0028C4B66B|nr:MULTISPECIES: SRPBCC domain-containing protein [unclassified Streptomyces]WNO73329.1 SRPBCC domain-containing protein [Streptomyces sp. AM8-1-1]
MDHEVFVPVPAETVRQTLRDPARVARCVTGLQQDADESAGPLSGRLKVRIANHSITYRGALRIVERDDAFTVEGDGVESRGTGSVQVTLTIRPTEAEGGTTIGFTGTSTAKGRLSELSGQSAEQAAHRMLDRFAERLATVAIEPPAGATGGGESPGPVSSDDAERLGLVDDEDATPDTRAGTQGATAETGDIAPDPLDEEEPGDEETPSTEETVFDAPVPPPSLGPLADDEFDTDLPGAADELEENDLDDLPGPPDEPMAEAAHARRTMIGRSAEEVDHAPPRGRYAPMPAPDATGVGVPLRWLAPAAALAVASAVVVGRALRRRR